jgi:hypothetical protein
VGSGFEDMGALFLNVYLNIEEIVKKVISTAQFKFFYHYYFDVGSTGV